MIKGNNPLTIRLFPDLGCYLYASTEEVLDAALIVLGVPNLMYTDVSINQGDIMDIDAAGQRSVTRFDDTKIQPRQFLCHWGWQEPDKESAKVSVPDDSYLQTVLAYGLRHGVSEGELRLLLNAGYDALDLEEMIHDDQFRACCVQEIMAGFGVY